MHIPLGLTSNILKHNHGQRMMIKISLRWQTYVIKGTFTLRAHQLIINCGWNNDDSYGRKYSISHKQLPQTQNYKPLKNNDPHMIENGK